MELNDSSPERNNKTNSQCTDNGSRTDRSSPKKSWQFLRRHSDRKGAKKRDHSPEDDWNRGKSPPRRNAKSMSEDEGKDRLKEKSKVHPSQQCQQQPIPIPTTTSSYPTNGYAASDYAVDPNQSNYMMPQCNMYNTLNQWGAPVNSGMPGMDMAATSTGMNPYPYVVPADPSMYGMMAPMPGFCPIPLMNGALPGMPQKTVKMFANCSLHPPPPSAPPPSRRERPNGCKTVFVGGLPEKITEEIVKEAFSECGEIATVRMSKKNFCHVRFTSEHHVDQALFFSGYRIKIENKDDPAYSGRLHVDFAVARDDQHEYQCLLRTLSREARHAQDSIFRPPSPPPIVNYSECKAATVGEQLRNEETFKQACQVLITWLDRGECNKRNAGTFYSMIQSTYSHVRRLAAEKTKIEDELQMVKNKLTQKCISNGIHFNDIEKVINCAKMQKVWDHFTKAQRKHIEGWKQHTTENKQVNLDDLLDERIEDEMEMSDSEDKGASEVSEKPSEVKEELNKLREKSVKLEEENVQLCNQLQTAKEEAALVKDESDKNMAALGNTYQMMQQNYLETKKKLEEALKERAALGNRENIFLDKTQKCNGNCPLAAGVVSVTESEARLVALIATFLNVHPFGASIDYICSYLVKMDRNVNTRDVENLMMKFPTVFKEESTGIGATLEKKWTFLGFKF